MTHTPPTQPTSPPTSQSLLWLDYTDRFALLRRLVLRISGPLGEAGCWQFRGTHSRGGRREVGYPNIRLGPASLPAFRVNRLVLLLGEVPQRTLARGTEADLLLWVLSLNRAHRSADAAHQCDAAGLGAACCNPSHLAWEAHTDNVRAGVWRKQQRDAGRAARAYLDRVRL
jgi:hypothetical protein